jgi:aspartate 1-decarboxylase
VKFEFPNIKLLDSSWKGLNDGAFIYDIKRRADMPTGASILSRVGIYFDYNDVVMTNTVQNMKGCPLPPVRIEEVHGRDVNIYPNPATNIITIQTNAASFATYTITNAVGQQVQTGRISGNETVVDINELPAGVYNISLNGAAGRQVKKFVKW